jgi:biotin synthase
MIALARLLLPKAMLPATTALGTLDPEGREKAMAAGANVVMPNLSPPNIRALYALYDHKLAAGEEAAEGLARLADRLRRAGYEPDFSRGDHVDFGGRGSPVFQARQWTSFQV